MASSRRLTSDLLVKPMSRAHGGARLALATGLSGHAAVMANGLDATDVGIEATNDLDGPGQAIPAPVRRSVLDAAQ